MADVPLEVSRLASGRGGLLAAEITSYRSNAVRPPPAGAATPVSLDEASGATWSLDYAPDGTLAMLSDRSGEFALWIKSPGEGARQLAGFARWIWGVSPGPLDPTALWCPSWSRAQPPSR